MRSNIKTSISSKNTKSLIKESTIPNEEQKIVFSFSNFLKESIVYNDFNNMYENKMDSINAVKDFFDSIKIISTLTISQLCNFNYEESKMSEMSEEVKKAYETWQKLNLNQEERDLAEQRYLNLASFEYAKEYEREEGRKESQKEIAKNMLNEDIDIEIIAKVTGLTIEEIKEL